MSWHPAFRPNSLSTQETPDASADVIRPLEASETQATNGVLGDQVTQDREESQPDVLPHTAKNAPFGEGRAEAFQLQNSDDTAWGFDSETQRLNHTNTFPPVPELHLLNGVSMVHPLPQSQAEQVMEQVEAEHEAMAGEETVAHPRDPLHEHGDIIADVLAELLGEAITPAGDAQEPSDAEARFEEGIPLVPKEQPEQGAAQFGAPEDAVNTGFDAFEDHATHDDFFSNGPPTNEPNVEPHPAPLDRKSTEQVLSSIKPSGLIPNPAPAVSGLEDIDLSKSTGGGIAVSTATVAAQVLSENVQKVEESGVSVTEGAKEEDLMALWQAALGDDDLLEEEPMVDPGSFFDDDGEGFLDESQVQSATSPPIPQPVHDSTGQLKGFNSLTRSVSEQYTPNNPRATPSYAPITPQPPIQPMNPYGQPAGQSMPAYSQYGRPALAQASRPAGLTSTPQSFVDKNKGGYTSPFDAPMDLSRPKRRPAQPIQPAQFQQDARSMPPPPPRTSSIVAIDSNNTISPTARPPPPSAGSYASSAHESEPRPQSKSSSSSFFEELPMASKPRPPSAAARAAMSPPTSLSPRTSSVSNQSTAPGPPQTNYGLVAPQRQMSFTDMPQQQVPQSGYSPAPSKTAPPVNTRYSPAPASAPQESPNRGRYAAPPPAGVPPRVPSTSSVNPYQPRTSSPLLHSSSAVQPQPAEERPLPSIPAEQSSRPPHVSAYQPQIPQNSVPQKGPAAYVARSTGLSQAFDPAMIERAQVKQRGPVQGISPTFTTHGPQRTVQQNIPRRANTLQDESNFLSPNDGTERDPMRRWQGAPIFRFGFGGSVVTSFPKRVPRFSTGQPSPSVKCAPGEVNVHTSRLLPLDDIITAFPGPLKTKSKKKDVVIWLNQGISRLEEEMSHIGYASPNSEHVKRREESLLLWKILNVYVDHDGVVDGNAIATAAIRQILTPEVYHDVSQGATGSTYYQSPAIVSRGEPKSPTSIRPGSVEEIRKLLLQGEREKAVWFAVDQKLWGHAMLLASTLPPETWKQVSQDFVKNEVKTAGDHTESLAALYDVFAGNGEESVDQLVPSSARAGLQMVSKTADGGPAKNAFGGLDRWRETLSMILSNRSTDDVRSLASLGQLLLSYGRTEAAHICYLFARLPGLISGADDPQAAIVLLGENHRQRPFDYAQDLYSVLLTEVYEFAACVLPTNPIPAFGHLQSFKLWHATMLAESGSSDQALQYCDAIAGTLKASTKASPYYHPRLFAAVEDLSSRIRSAPRDGSGSWMSKPNMDKVSGSMWNKFTQFVAGEESDATSVASKAEAEGPFSRISGDTPSVSRGPSPGVEQFGPYSGAGGYAPTAAKAVPTSSRYAPRTGNALNEGNGINRQPSVSSFGSSSPDLHRSYAPQSQGQGHAMPAQALSYSPKDSTSYAMNHTSSPLAGTQATGPPAAASPGHIFPGAGRSDSDAGLPSPYSAGTGSPLGAHQVFGRASPYEPHSSNYAPRAASYEPRSYQPSPKLEETAPPDVSYGSPPKEPRSIPTQISTTAEGMLAPQVTPTIQHVPPTPTGPLQPPTALSTGYNPQSSPQPQPSYEPSPPAQAASTSYEPNSASSEPAALSYEPPSYGYEPSTSSYEPPASSYEPPASSYEPPGSSYEPLSSSYEPPSSSYEPPGSSYEPPSSSYEPPNSSYEPPSAPYPPPSTSTPMNGSTDAAHPKKKSIMDLSDDEDDLVSRARSLKSSQRSANDRAADDAFRKAAEADALRDKAPSSQKLNSKPSGWLGGWFSRGKGEDSAGGVGPADAGGSKKPIKARLGEESSFYYDAELKKWVNRKGGAEAAAPVAPTPPPPRGPPSRSASAAPPMGGPPRAPTSNPVGTPPTGPPSAMGSRQASPGSAPPTMGGAAAPGEAAAGLPSGLPAGLAPPSRPGTGLSSVSTASSIDDLIGAAAPRKGGTVRKAKKKGYVDVMAK